jgi:hypothetical protein
VVPGGEFVDATGVVPGAVKAWLKTQAENRAIHDMGRSLKCNFMNDPIYNALMNMAQGQPLSPAEHAAIQQRLSRGEPRDFWSWFWSIL